MKNFPIHIKPFGNKAILVEWPAEIQETILSDILGFVDAFSNGYSAEWELIPSYNSVTMVWKGAKIPDFETVKTSIEEAYAKRKKFFRKKENFLWKLPVCYDLEFGLDLKETSEKLNLSTQELISLHTSHEYLVYGIGFLPGFMYLGGLPDKLQTPRRKQPRLQVNKGSVGLAAKQTGIYPQDSPGGWNIIGNCPIPIFDVSKASPCFVGIGDRIQFESISRAEYDLRKIEAEIGIYNLEKIGMDA